MYVYDDFDRTLVDERVREFRDQVARRLSGEVDGRRVQAVAAHERRLSAAARLYAADRHPYGTLSSAQLRTLAHVARRYDRDYGHFTTRQNIQFNWIKLEELPDAMADLADAGLHGMQTSGNCVRNITTDQWAGRGAGRDRGSAAVGGTAAPAPDAAPGILVPAAQVQDCADRIRARSRRGACARHRPCGCTGMAPARPASR
jgi:sulfite reductase beta subunit-like hemoprotein